MLLERSAAYLPGRYAAWLFMVENEALSLRWIPTGLWFIESWVERIEIAAVQVFLDGAEGFTETGGLK